MSLIEKYNPVTARQERGPLELDELSPELARLLTARERMLLQMIRATRCMSAECCAKAMAALDELDLGDVMILATDDVTQEFNVADPGTPAKWNLQQHVGSGFSHSMGIAQRSKGNVTIPGWIRIYGLLTYSSFTADVSLSVRIRKNGTTFLVGDGRHGYISTTNGHTTSSSSIETWAELAAGDYVEVISTQNGAVGTANPVAGASLLIMERKPYTLTTPPEPV